MATEKEMYWVAGILEGEGYFGVRRSCRDLVIQVTMTDADVIQRVKDILECGNIKSRTLPSGKIASTLTISAQSDAKKVMQSVLPLMGERRSAKIRYCLEQRATVPPPRREWTSCKHGHPLHGDNLRIVHEGKYTKRRCVTCGKERQRKHRALMAAHK